jgi:hypothetical protein
MEIQGDMVLERKTYRQQQTDGHRPEIIIFPTPPDQYESNEISLISL